tara:strand:- start:28 stop:840 length:813 start_codon:yes stop_codon:yes gene_type:complete
MLNIILKFFYKIRLFRRVIPSIVRKISFFKKNHIVQLDGFKLNLSLKNSLDRRIFLEGVYESDRVTFLEKSTKDIDFNYFIDIGAYIGYYSLYFSKFKNINQIISIEPNKESFLNLLNNISLNKSDIIAHNIACSNKNEIKKLWFSDPNKKSGSSILDKDDFEYKKYSADIKQNKDYQISKDDLIYETVNSRKLDDIISINNKNIIVKIDVERHEMSVLEGAKNIFFNKNKVFLQVEIYPEYKEKIISFLTKNNYKLIHSIEWDYYFKNY